MNLFVVIANGQCGLVFNLEVFNESCFGAADGSTNLILLNNTVVSDSVSNLPYCPSYPSSLLIQPSAIIEEVILNGDNTSINNNTTGVADFYEDYTASMYSDMTLGQPYSISVTLNGVGAPGNSINNSGAKVYIDYNIDGDFNGIGEEIGVIPYRDTTTLGVPEVINFTIPVTAGIGATRMRVVSQYQSTPNPSSIGPCDAAIGMSEPWFGATEDYSIVLNNPTVSATYLWSTGQTSNSISSLSSGNYSVDITDANGCVSTENFTISSGSAITVLASSDQTICNGGTPTPVSVLVSSIGSFLWTPSSDFINASIQNPIFSSNPNSTTVYSVSFTDTSGCVASDDVIISVNPLPSVTLTALPNPACLGDDIVLTATSSIPVNKYKFQVNSGSWSNLTSPGWGNSSSFTYNNITTTTQFRVKVRENFGCNTSSWSTITVPISIITTQPINHN